MERVFGGTPNTARETRALPISVCEGRMPFLKNEQTKRESARGLAQSKTPAFVPLRRGKQAASPEYDISIVIRAF